MGPAGTEGAFTSAAEATMKVLKENSSALLTILSAVVSDPLYKWSVSPITARQHQRDKDDDDDNNVVDVLLKEEKVKFECMISESENDAASRAIAKISEKLQGYEEGTLGERQTIQGQVQLLINAARDHDNLSALFPGWCPWL